MFSVKKGNKGVRIWTLVHSFHIYRGYCTAVMRYEFYVLVARTKSHSFAALTHEILIIVLATRT